MDSLTFCATVLCTPDNTGHCQGHLLTPYGQLLGWISLTTGHPSHLQRQFELFFRSMIVKVTYCLKIWYCDSTLGDDLFDDILFLVSSPFTRLAALLSVFLIAVLPTKKLDKPGSATGQLCRYSSILAHCVKWTVVVLPRRSPWGKARQKRLDHLSVSS